ncbi:MAG: UPF0301 protein [Gemmatimonadota bacterium]|nr:MAG: UPF0301 protein [Gemmatimonadota bacterium]
MHSVDHVTRGTFLVASPLLRDPNFLRTVVLMCEHADEGSWGLVINRRTALTYGELLEDLPFPAAAGGRVFWGGPVQPERMQTLYHLRRDLGDRSEVCPGVDLGLDLDTFREVVSTSLTPGESLHAYVGHAGWGPGQLAAELETGSWITCTGEASFVFDTEPDEMWERVLQSLGKGFAKLANVPPDPRVN